MANSMSNEAILIHGWNPDLYNSNLQINNGEGVAWEEQPVFTRLLQMNFDLAYYNHPGFCGVPEPAEKYYDLDAFTEKFSDWKNKHHPYAKLLIGHSFGGAVALNYKALSGDSISTVLTSPAIYRGETARSGIARNTKRIIPDPVEAYFKHLYQFIMSPYYRKGTPFLRMSYDSIVREDLRPLLKSIDVGGIFLIYGVNDNETPWEEVEETVVRTEIPYHIVVDGAHRLWVSHPQEIVDQIIEFYFRK